MQLLDVDESTRLGSDGPDSVKSHPWFAEVDWKAVRDHTIAIPEEITSLIAHYLESHPDDCPIPPSSPPRDLDELNTPEWLEDW